MEREQEALPVRRQLQDLRRVMGQHQVDAYLVPTEDFHGSEYVGEYFACRQYVSGFTGSAGTLLVFPNWAGLWTDGRYFLQAEEELAGSGIRLMKSGQPGVPTVEGFLRQSIQAGQVLGFDGRCVSARAGRSYYRLMQELGGRINEQLDLVGEIWAKRPPLPAQPVWELPLSEAGESRADKLAWARRAMAREKADALLLTTLEDIAWLLNLRGGDIACTPVFLAYLVLNREEALLFAEPSAFSPALLAALEADGVSVQPYQTVYRCVGGFAAGERVLLDTRQVNTRLLTSIPSAVHVVDQPNPVERRKAVKNETELQNMARTHVLDGIALTRFMYWVKQNAGKQPMTECSAAAHLEALRQEQPGYLGPSFAPILAFGVHGAVIHYTPTPDSDLAITDEGFLLADTGGHYRTGTTDCTRTYALGPLTAAQRAEYTAVLRGNLQLSSAVFRAGTPGTNLDYVARRPLWELGLDYNHGTGHGVGYLLSVHEGPQSIRQKPTDGKIVPLLPGMITSNEPGFYRDGHYGIRLENLEQCVEKTTTPYGRFLGFETLTLTPFDLDAVEPSLMSEAERHLLNAYHARVYERLAAHLPEEEAAWLREATREV